MKRRFFILLNLISLIASSQTPFVVNGIDTTVITYQGYNIARRSALDLLIENSKFTSAITSGYLLQVGDDNYSTSTAHNLDNAVISGNYIDYKGTPGSGGLHGIMAGYNINYTIKYNYIDDPFYGLVYEAGYDDGSTMINTAGGIYGNIFRNCSHIPMAGFENVYFYDNTFYQGLTSVGWIIRIDTSNGTTIGAPSKNVKIKNNIFYIKNNDAIICVRPSCTTGFECDYNVYYCETSSGHKPRFSYDGVDKTWEQWQALGFDTHSVVENPNFIDTLSFVPSTPLYYGTNLGGRFSYGLAIDAKWVIGEHPDTVKQNDVWQVGARIFNTSALIPKYISSLIDNSTPSRLEMIYNLTMADTVPDASSFIVTVNSFPMIISSVAVSGTKVILTLASQVVYGDVVTVSYSRPSTNPLQSSAGGYAASLINQSVTNNYMPNQSLISLYPDPNNGHFTIGFLPSLPTEEYRVTIISSMGETVYRGFLEKGENKREYDLSNIDSDIYIFIIAIDTTIIATKKFAKV